MPRALANTIDQIARRTTGKDWKLYAGLLEHWQEIVGPDYARVTTPVKLTFPHQPNEAHRRSGNLCIRLPKGLAMEFSFQTETIRQRINGYFGHDAIERITFDPVYEAPAPSRIKKEADPLALAQIRETSGTVEDEALRQALKSFGEAIVKGQ